MHTRSRRGLGTPRPPDLLCAILTPHFLVDSPVCVILNFRSICLFLSLHALRYPTFPSCDLPRPSIFSSFPPSGSSLHFPDRLGHSDVHSFSILDITCPGPDSRPFISSMLSMFCFNTTSTMFSSNLTIVHLAFRAKFRSTCSRSCRFPIQLEVLKRAVS